MRFLMMHRLDESAPEAWNPSPEFMQQMGAFIQDSMEKGILITAEGVHPSDKGALVRKAKGTGITATDGPFTEAKETILSFALVEARSKDEAIELARRFWLIAGNGEGAIRQVYGPD